MIIKEAITERFFSSVITIFLITGREISDLLQRKRVKWGVKLGECISLLEHNTSNAAL